MTNKILTALGNLVRCALLPGQRLDRGGVPPLIEGVAFVALLADKAFDSNAIIHLAAVLIKSRWNPPDLSSYIDIRSSPFKEAFFEYG